MQAFSACVLAFKCLNGMDSNVPRTEASRESRWSIIMAPVAAATSSAPDRSRPASANTPASTQRCSIRESMPSAQTQVLRHCREPPELCFELGFFSVHKGHPLIGGGHFNFSFSRGCFDFKWAGKNCNLPVGEVPWEAVQVKAPFENQPCHKRCIGNPANAPLCHSNIFCADMKHSVEFSCDGLCRGHDALGKMVASDFRLWSPSSLFWRLAKRRWLSSGLMSSTRASSVSRVACEAR